MLLMEAKSIENNLSVGFHRSLGKFPLRPALEVNDRVYTYQQLAHMAARLSGAIKELRNVDQKLIGLLAYRSAGAYAGILGILGVGCGYVPLHPEYPAERNLKILNLSATEIMIVMPESQGAFDKLLPLIEQKMIFILVGLERADAYAKKYSRQVFIVINQLGDKGERHAEIDPVAKDDLAYLLFTSGSTGEPKGVPVSHHNVRSYVEFITKRYDLNEHDRCSQMHDLTFDFSVHDIYPTWEKGACLCVATKEDKLFPVGYIQKKKLTSWASVPSVGSIIDKYGRLLPGVFPTLRYSFFCGEALYANMAEKWGKAAPHVRIINLYGPTEATMAISVYDWDAQRSPQQCLNGIVPIGHMFDGQMARVTLENGQEAGTEETGELCLSGSQVTKGYWKDPKLSAAKYVVFPETGDRRWYRTGDLARRGSDGCLYYLGRMDSQIKILGNRIELGEIDHVLREASGVELAVAIAWPVNGAVADGVVAFICGAKDIKEQAILEFCRAKLPKYMVPNRVNFLEEMPFNNNGKVDRMKLTQLLEKDQCTYVKLS